MSYSIYYFVTGVLVSLVSQLPAEGLFNVSNALRGGRALQEHCDPPGTQYMIQFIWGFNYESVGDYLEFSTEMQQSYMRKLFEEIAATYPGSEFGVVHFEDWRFVGPECFEVLYPLTPSIDLAVKSFQKKAIRFGGESPERSLGAIALTANYQHMGWIRDETDSMGRRVVRVIAISADDKFLPGEEDYRGLEYGQCISANPSVEGVANILKDKNIRLLGLISGEYLKFWKDGGREMTRHGAVVAVEQLNLKDTSYILKTVLEGISKVICSTTTTTTTMTTTTTAASGPGIPHRRCIKIS